MEYKGWTLYDEVTLVIKKNMHRQYKLPQAYIVNSKDKKQLERAINWGTDWEYIRDESGNYMYDDSNNIIRNEIKPNIITIKNESFNISLLDFAHDSYQGGKLSFWNCIIEHKDYNIKCVVGIASDLLLSLLIQNKFSYGKCENTVRFARQSGGVGMLSDNMVEYQEALKDMQTKKDINKGKTTKWQIGHNYVTLTLDEIYMGSVYKLLKSDYNPERNSYYYRSDFPYYIVNMNNIHNNIIVDTNAIPEHINSNSELEAYLIDKCNQNKEVLLQKLKDKTKNNQLSILLNDMTVVFRRNTYGSYITSNKFPSRQTGDRIIHQDKPIEDVITNVVAYVQDIAVEILKEYTVDDLRHTVEQLLIRPNEFSNELDDLSDSEAFLLKELIKLNNKPHEHKLSDDLYSKINKL